MRSDTEFYPTLPNISLRDEFERLLRGDVGVVGIGRPVIYRRMTNDKCACWDDKTGGPLYYCSYCLGEGFTFTEEEDLAYIADGTTPLYKPGFFGTGEYPLIQIGLMDPSKATGFMSWSLFRDYERYTYRTDKHYDKLLLLKVDDEGRCVYPQVVTAKYKVMNVIPRHGDFGRVEYIELSLEKETIG